MAYTLNRRLAELIDSNGQLATGKIATGYISTAHFASNSITDAKLHSTFALPASALSARDTGDLSEGSNLYYTTARWDSKLAAADTGDLSEGSNLYYTDARVATYISGSRTFGNITTTGYIAGPASMVIDPAGVGDNTGTVVIAGNLQVDGTTTTINSTTVSIDDLNFTIASDAADSSAANGAGITIGGASATMLYTHATTSFDFNKPITSSGNVTLGSSTAGNLQVGSANSFQIQKSGVNAYINQSDSGPIIVRMGSGFTERLIINNAGNIGLGVTPNANWSSSYRAIDAFGGATLQFEANSTRQGQNFYGYPWKYKAATTASSIAHTSTGDISMQTAPSGSANAAITWTSRLHIKNTGNVGIGTAAPGSKLELRTDTSSGGYGDYPALTIRNDNAAGYGAIHFNEGSTQRARVEVGNNSGNPYLGLYTGSGSSGITIKGGNVGINESSPLGKLHVKAQDTGATANSVGNLLVLEGTENGLSILSSTSGAGYILFGDSDDNAHGGILYDQSAGAMRFRTGSTWDQMKILANGNVGIGTASPNAGLEVLKAGGGKIRISETAAKYVEIIGYAEGTANGSTMAFQTIQAGTSTSTERMRINSAGNIGIGSNNPGDIRLKVHSNDSDDYIAIFKQTHASNLGTVQIDTPSDSNARPSRLDFARGGVNKWKTGMVYGDSTNGWGLSDATGSGTALQQTRFLVTPAGNVGIGTNNPVSVLNIEGNSNGWVTAPMLVMSTTSTADARVRDWAIGPADSAYGDFHILQGASTGASPLATANSKLMIDAVGNVSIGNAGAAIPAAANLYIKDASDSRLIIFESGASPYTSTLELASQAIGTYGAEVQYTSGAERLTLRNYGRTLSAGSMAGSIGFKTKVNNSNHSEVMFIHGYTGNVGIGNFTSPPASKLHLESGNAHNKLSITSTASGGTGYDAVIDLLGSASNSETAINMGINGDADREQIKAYQSYLSLRTNNVERISYQPTQGSVYENIHTNFTGNLNISLLRGMRFARAGSIADDTKIKLFQGSYTYSGGTIDYIITDGGGSQNHVGSGTINWYSRESTCHFTLTGTNVGNKIVVNADTSGGTYADGKFTIAIRGTNGDSHISIMNRLGSMIYIGLKISVNYVG